MTHLPDVTDMVALVERALSISLVNRSPASLWRGEIGRPAEAVIVVTPDGIEFRCQVRPHHTERKLRERLLLSSREPEG